MSGKIDYLGEVTVARAEQDRIAEPFFTGEIKSVRLGATSLILDCLSGLNVSDHRAGFLQYQRCGVDVAYSLMRTAGHHDDEMDFEGLDALPHEQFSIALPLEGVGISNDQVRLPGPVYVIGQAEASELLNPSDAPLDPHNQSGFLNLSSNNTFVLARVWSFTAHEAQSEALRKIDDALAYLTLASRYTLSSLPSGEATSYDRSSLTFYCRRGQLLVLRGASTGRAWLREAPAGLRESVLSLRHPPLEYVNDLSPQGVPDRTTSLLVRLAARAAVLTDPVDRVTTLWQAIEFYAANTRVTELFDPDTQKEIKHVLKKHVRRGISQEQNARLDQALASLNNPPLMSKLREQLNLDRVPIGESEMELLARLRDFRNRSNHGRATLRLSRAEIDRGVAITARIAIFLMHRTST